MKVIKEKAPHQSSGASSPHTMQTILPGLVSLGIAAFLGLGVWLVVATEVTWTPLPFFIKWYHALLIDLLLLAAVVCVAVWSFKQRRWWVLCIPAIVGWVLFSGVLVLALTPHDDYHRFIFECATIRRGETIESFEARMKAWGRRVAPEWVGTPSSMFSEAAFRSGHAGAQVFYVYFDENTREIRKWEFLHD